MNFFRDVFKIFLILVALFSIGGSFAFLFLPRIVPAMEYATEYNTLKLEITLYRILPGTFLTIHSEEYEAVFINQSPLSFAGANLDAISALNVGETATMRIKYEDLHLLDTQQRINFYSLQGEGEVILSLEGSNRWVTFQNDNRYHMRFGAIPFFIFGVVAVLIFIYIIRKERLAR